MKTLVIGDIHGCFVELADLLEQAGLSSSDIIIGLGDIVDRGPETPRVLDFFRRQPNSRSLMGNHERKHIRSYRGELKPSLSQIISKTQFGDDYHQAIAFMNSFPTFIELPEALLVHGYLEPGDPLEDQLVTVLCGTMGGDKHLKKYDRPWYELYDGEKPVIVGHLDYTAKEQPGRHGQPFVYRDKVFGLDTSCVLGGRLTGLILPDFRFVSVASRGDYWAELRLQHHVQEMTRAGTSTNATRIPIPWDDESIKRLAKILEFVVRENTRLMAQLEVDPSFNQLSSRQQAKAYAALVQDSPVNALLHLARRGELSPESGRRVFREADEVKQIAGQVGLD